MLIVKRHTEYFAQDQNQIILFVQSVNIAQSSSLHLTLWRTFQAKAILSTIQLSFLFILDASSIHCWDSNPGPSEHESFPNTTRQQGKGSKKVLRKILNWKVTVLIATAIPTVPLPCQTISSGIKCQQEISGMVVTLEF